MNVLVLNVGSSTVKFRLFRIERTGPPSHLETAVISGQIDNIHSTDAVLSFSTDSSLPLRTRRLDTSSVEESIRAILTLLKSKATFDGPVPTIDVIGHRIVHGGPKLFTATTITDAVLAQLHQVSNLAPLHNPPALTAISVASEYLPDLPHVAVFDTGFHHHLPAIAAQYALPSEMCARLSLRRYGFHGISYSYASERISAALTKTYNQDPTTARVILCHLGNGASVCAVKGGQSIDTSMGFTPLEGLIMGSRSGDLDPGLLLHLMDRDSMTATQVLNLITHQSGLLGISQRSSDVRELERYASEGDENAALALRCFAYRVKKYIGAYAASLGGVDALAFTGGIGEHSAGIRALICSGLQFLQLHVDGERSFMNYTETADPFEIGAVPGKVWIVSANEELQIAREVVTLLS